MRRFFKILGGLAAGALFVLATLPWWLGPVLTGVAGHYHASYGRYERIGYARFAVRDVVVDLPTVRVTVEHAESATPALWLLRRLTGDPAPIVTTHWRVEVKPGAGPAAAPGAPPAQPGGAMRLRAILGKVAAGLERWSPHAAVGAGAVTWPGGELHLGSATWEQRALMVHGFRFGVLAADVRVAFPADGTIEFQASSDTPAWRTSLRNKGNEISGDGRWWDQLATVKAILPATGWMPAEADVRAEHWTVTGARLKLGQFYSAVHGDARIEWRAGKFETSLDVAGDAIPDRKAPPLTAKLRGHGDREALTIESLTVDIPGVKAALSAPVVIDRHGRIRGGESHFSLAADLEKQPWVAAKGRVTGEVQLKPRDGRAPLIDGILHAQDIALLGCAVARFDATAELDWPRLQVKSAEFGFAEGAQLKAQGGWDIAAQEIRDATVDGTLRPSAVARWLPASVRFESLTIAAKASGPLATLAHAGKIHVTALTLPGLRPLAADATWQGTGAALAIEEARAQAGDSQLALAGTVDASGGQLTGLKLIQGKTERLTLAAPVAVHWSPRIEIGPVQFAGDGASVALTATAGESGRLTLAARNFSSAWLADFTPLPFGTVLGGPGPEWRIISFATEGEWDHGPLTFKTEGEVTVAIGDGRLATVAFKARGGKNGVEIESLQVAEGSAPIVTATGRLPVTLHPGAAPLVRLEETAALALHGQTASNPAFWKKLSETTGLDFENPEVTVELSGTWARPLGDVRAKAARLVADDKRFNLPVFSVDALEVHVVADRAGIAVDQLAAQVEGQAVRASGKLAFTPEQWPDLKREPVAFLRQHGSARLEIPEAGFAVIARHFPAFLAPVGRVTVDATFAPGGEMKGTVQLHGAATRPLGGLGVLQDIGGEVQLAGSTVEVRSVTAVAGGQTVTVSGKVELPLNGAPIFDLALKGENLPLVRQTGLLVRADVALKLVTTRDASAGSPPASAPLLSGTVTLRDSVFLSDLRAFIPRGRGGAPGRRPPYFAIESPPLNAWRLNVDVRGDKFMRLHSTVFAGVASARFNLGGTLGDPSMRGEATVDTGTVMLPFASFKIEAAAVRVTDADPNSLQLAATGTARRYGYDLRMEVSGTADAPVVVFNSTPVLEAKQVLLMVTAGELPHDEITYGTAQRAARLGTYLGQSLISTFGGDTTEADRLSITTGERISDLGRETYDVEYRLTDRFTLVGEYDEYDAYNTGVKWSMRPPAADAAKKPAPAAATKEEAPLEQPR